MCVSEFLVEIIGHTRNIYTDQDGFQGRKKISFVLALFNPHKNQVK